MSDRNDNFYARYLDRPGAVENVGFEDRVGRADVEAHAAQAQEPGAKPDEISVIDGAAAPGQPPAATMMGDRSRPGTGIGRHGYDADPITDDPAPDARVAGGFDPPSHAASPPMGIGDPRSGGASSGGRDAPGGRPPHSPGPQHPGPLYPDVPQFVPPSGPANYSPPDYPVPNTVGHDDPAALRRRPPTPPAPQRGYVPDLAADPQQRLLPPADARGVSVGDMRAQIRESYVAPPYKPVPQTGWRKGLYRVTRINVGLSQDEREFNELRRRLKVNLRGKYVIAVMGAKGGVNKTTATICIGAALKQYRDDKIVAIDANPASGNLAKRIDEPVTLSWRGLISDPNLRDSSDFLSYLGRDNSSGLNVLGSDPGDQVLSGAALSEAWRRLQVQYPIAILDCGNQVRDDITRVILDEIPANAIVVPSTTRLDGAKGAAETLNWLLTHGYPHLVREAVVVVSNINKVNASRQVRRLHEDFERTVRAVHDVPFDEHLSDAVAIDFARLGPETRRAYIEAAASLVDGFAGAADRESSDPHWSPGGQP